MSNYVVFRTTSVLPPGGADYDTPIVTPPSYILSGEGLVRWTRKNLQSAKDCVTLIGCIAHLLNNGWMVFKETALATPVETASDLGD